MIDARYTDSGGQGGSQALTGSATSVYRPRRFQAHYYDENQGVAVEFNAAAEYGQYVGAIQDNDWIKYEGMNFANIDGLRYRVSAGPEGGGRIEARIGSPSRGVAREHARQQHRRLVHLRDDADDADHRTGGQARRLSGVPLEPGRELVDDARRLRGGGRRCRGRRAGGPDGAADRPHERG